MHVYNHADLRRKCMHYMYTQSPNHLAVKKTPDHTSHTVEDVIENVIENAIKDEIENYSRVLFPSEFSKLQRVLRYQKSLQQPSPDPIEFKSDVKRKTKRSCDEIATYESRKRWRR